MDKEQAIDLLDNLIGMIEDNQDNDYDTAFRMAIEALKAQLSQQGTTSDLISRQQALDAVGKCASVWMEYTDAMSKDEIAQIALNNAKSTMIRILKELPTIQPEPKEGHWIEGGIYRDVIECYCSECGQIMTTVATVRMNYCPNCGAKMRGEQDEH